MSSPRSLGGGRAACPSTCAAEATARGAPCPAASRSTSPPSTHRGRRHARACRRRCHVGPGRPRARRARPRDLLRRHRFSRRRRPDPRRRHRLDGAGVGLAADQLVGRELVTARGEVIEVPRPPIPICFWALRGGGGNFGVVTRFDFRAHPLSAVVFADPRRRWRSASCRCGTAGHARRRPARAHRHLHGRAADGPQRAGRSDDHGVLDGRRRGGGPRGARAAPRARRASPRSIRRAGVSRCPDGHARRPIPTQPMPGFVGGNTLLRSSDDGRDRRVWSPSARPTGLGAVPALPRRGLRRRAADATAFPARGATWFAMAGVFDVPGLVRRRQRGRDPGGVGRDRGSGRGLYGNFTPSTDGRLSTRMYPPATLASSAAIKRE